MRMLLFCSLFVSAVSGAAEKTDDLTIDLTWRLHARNTLVIAKQQTRSFFRDRNVQYRLRQWLNAPANRLTVESCQEYLSPLFHSYNTLSALCWAKRQNSAEADEAIKWLLTYYYLDLAVALLELRDDPRYEKHYQELAGNLLAYFQNYDEELTRMRTCFASKSHAAIASCLYRNFAKVKRPKHHLYVRLASKHDMLADEDIPYFALNTAQTFPFHFGHANSETGWVGGNTTRYAITTRTDANLGKALNNSNTKLARLYPAWGQGSLQTLYNRIKSRGFRSVFAESELNDSQLSSNNGGALTAISKLIWGNIDYETPAALDVYVETAKLIRSAEQTIFIDMFAFGGVIGVGMAKLILEQLEAKPQLKVFILRDVVNHFGSLEEQVPIFNYLLAYSYLFPQRLIVSEAHIYDHISGLPHYLATVINDDLVSNTGIQSTLNLALQAVSDHSKLLVVDGKSKHPKAMVSSKNWGDRTGAIFFDDGVIVEGAAAAIVQDDFYHDMRLGLQKVMAHKYPAGKITGQASYIDTLYQAVVEGGAQSLPLNHKISEILRDFDLLERDANLTPRVHSISYPATDNSVLVRSGFNSVDSSTTQIIDQNIQSILLAKKNIYINEQFVFDPKIITALLRVKEIRPQVDIRLILEHALEVEPDGVPNSLYLDLLINGGIKIRWKNTRWVGNIPQKNHSKTLSVDGKFLIVGSANKDAMTMYGSFRDQQVTVIDEATTAEHDRVFLKWWDNVDPDADKGLLSRDPYGEFTYDTEQVNPYAFKVPDYFVDFAGKPLSPKAFLRLMRGIIKFLYDYTVL